MKKILVTGAGGYIGTQLVRDLVKAGEEVTAVDRFFFGKETLDEFANNSKVNIVQKDIRDLTEKDFENHDAVCDLACLSNDPTGEIDPELTYSINRDGRIHVAKTSKSAGVKNYLISSSCSVYGQGEELKLTENSRTNPISVYAKSTLEAEQANLELADDNFIVTSLRNATVFGLSKRMRFDLVINLMTLTAYQKGRIFVMGGGEQWRPLIHISDVTKAFLTVLNCENKKVNGQIFNIGLENFQIKSLAMLIKSVLPVPIQIDFAPDDADKRDYNVVFKKANEILNFTATKDIKFGVSEIFSALNLGIVDTSIKTNTVQWYKNIIESKRVVDSIMINNRLI